MQLEFFIGSESVLKGWERKQALLVALRPRDRLRLLGLVRLPSARLMHRSTALQERPGH